MKIQIAEIINRGNYKSDNYKSEICKSGFRPKEVVADAKTADNRLIARFLQCVPRGGNKTSDAKKPTLTRGATKGRFSNIV